MPGPYLNVGPFKTAVDETVTDQRLADELGVWRFEAGKILRYVQAAALIPRFEALRVDATVTTAGLIGHRVLQTSGATDMFMGIAEVTFPNLGFGWATIYGRATARVVAGEIPGSPLGPSSTTGVLTIRNTSHFNAAAIALQSGLSAGSAIFVSVL